MGYPTGTSVRVVVRAPAEDGVGAGATCALTTAAGATAARATLKPFGECWHAYWWVADFGTGVPVGEYDVSVAGATAAGLALSAPGLRVADDVLWAETHDHIAAEMLEARANFTGVGAGWQDAGALWAESPAQAAMLICLCDVAQSGDPDINGELLERIYKQITVGADYFLLCAAAAVELGHPVGAQSHDVIKHQAYVLPNDTAKAVVALYRTLDALPADRFAEQRTKYAKAAKDSLDYLLQLAEPIRRPGHEQAPARHH